MSFIWPQEVFIFNITYPVALIRPSFVFSRGKISNFYLTSGFQLVVFYFVFESFGDIRYFFLTKHSFLVIVGNIDRPSALEFSGIRIFVLEMCFQIYAQVCQDKLIIKKNQYLPGMVVFAFNLSTWRQADLYEFEGSL